MTITPKTLIFHCLIGLEVKIIQSTNPFHQNISGKIVDETKKTFLIKTTTNEKRIPKKGSIFRFYLPNARIVEVLGNLLLGRPEERIKKKINKWN
ncbi:MAG: ribonuclease P protein component 1 [Candidatus Helarchaeota archaeon]